VFLRDRGGTRVADCPGVYASQPGETTDSERIVSRMMALIHTRYAGVVTLRTLGAALDQRPKHLGWVFRRTLGISARECLTRVRIDHAIELIQAGVKIEAIALIVGYRSKKNFYRQFKRRYSTTPEAFRRAGRPGTADHV
jgi:YesN/AraC family two-component response regulator